jgi:hypothetical protein
VLDRGHGRPRQAFELTGTDAGPVRIEDVRARNLALIEAVAERARDRQARHATGGRGPPSSPRSNIMGLSRRIAMSSISRRRNGLMALSVIGGYCLG